MSRTLASSSLYPLYSLSYQVLPIHFSKYFLNLSNSFYLYCPHSFSRLFFLPTDINWDLLCVMLSTWDLVERKTDLISSPYQACSLGGEMNIKQVLTYITKKLIHSTVIFAYNAATASYMASWSPVLPPLYPYTTLR